MRLEAAREPALARRHHLPLQLLTLRVTRQKTITPILRKPHLSPTTVPTPPPGPDAPGSHVPSGANCRGLSPATPEAAPQGLRTHSEAQPGRSRARGDAPSRSIPISRGSVKNQWDGVGLRPWGKVTDPTTRHALTRQRHRARAYAPGPGGNPRAPFNPGSE